MAFVVARPRGRWEIRESILTPAGPRARTLASFTELSDDVVARAARAARARFDRESVVRAARRAGVPFAGNRGDRLAEALLRSISRGEAPRPGLRRLLCARLETPETDEGLADWIGASAAERGAALVDLLGLADRLPKPRKTPLTFPRLSPSRPPS